MDAGEPPGVSRPHGAPRPTVPEEFRASAPAVQAAGQPTWTPQRPAFEPPKYQRPSYQSQQEFRVDLRARRWITSTQTPRRSPRHPPQPRMPDGGWARSTASSARCQASRQPSPPCPHRQSRWTLGLADPCPRRTRSSPWPKSTTQRSGPPSASRQLLRCAATRVAQQQLPQEPLQTPPAPLPNLASRAKAALSTGKIRGTRLSANPRPLRRDRGIRPPPLTLSRPTWARMAFASSSV